MATAYHLEALRRQRIMDKRAEAKRKLEEKERSPGIPEESGHTEPAISRGSTAHSNTSRKSKASTPSSKHTTPAHSRASTAETGHSRASTAETGRSRASTAETGHSRASTAENKSKSVLTEQSRVSSATGNHSGQSSPRNSQAKGSASRGVTSEGGGATGSARSSKQPTPNHSRPSTAPGSSAASSKQSQHRLGSLSPANELQDDGENGERRSRILNTAELKVEAVRRDLKNQELVLRDSNLVMGTVPLEEEMEMEGRGPMQSGGHVA